MSALPEDFAAALVDAMPDAVLFADADGTIRFWNQGATRILGHAAEDALGRNLALIIPEGLRARHDEGFRRTMATGETRYGAGETLAVPALRADGARISVEFTIVPFRDQAGAMAGIAAVLRDVTARFEELRALRRELAASRQA